MAQDNQGYGRGGQYRRNKDSHHPAALVQGDKGTPGICRRYMTQTEAILHPRLNG
jgi:hypothetical protein